MVWEFVKEKTLNLPIRVKIYFVLLVFVFTGGVVFLTFLRIASEITLDTKMVNRSGTMRMKTYKVLNMFKGRQMREGSLQADGFAEELDIYRKTFVEVGNYIESRGDETQYISNASQEMKAFVERWNAMDVLLKTALSNPAAYGALAPAINAAGEELVAIADRIVGNIERHAGARMEKAGRTMAGLFFFSVLMVSLVAYIFVRYMLRPMARVKEFAGEISKRNFSARLDYKGRDEVGMLIRAMNDMAAELNGVYAGMEEKIKDKTRQLAAVEKFAAIGQVSAGVAHEINNPLQAIQICAEGLQRRLRDNSFSNEEDRATAQGYIRIINDEIKRCALITGGLLDFSKDRELNKNETDVKGLLLDVGKNVTLQKDYSTYCKVEYQFNCDDHTVIADPTQLRHVWLNLMTNGFDAMGRKGTLIVSTQYLDRLGKERLGIKFIDHGCGIQPDDMGKIFMPFFTTKKDKGTGLGLLICEKIVAMHGGSIEVQSKPGEGSVFTVILPLAGLSKDIDKIDRPSTDTARGLMIC